MAGKFDGLKYKRGGKNFFTGLGWGMSRRAYDKIGGLFELCIIGSADFLMVLVFKNQSAEFIMKTLSLPSAFYPYIEDWINKVKPFIH